MVFHSGFLFTSTIENGIVIVVLSINGQKAAVLKYQTPMAEVSKVLSWRLGPLGSDDFEPPKSKYQHDAFFCKNSTGF